MFTVVNICPLHQAPHLKKHIIIHSSGVQLEQKYVCQ